MTAAIFFIAPDQVIVATDTLAVAGDTGSPLMFTTKFYPLPHLGGAMFATGLGDLAARWFGKLQRFVATDIQHLDQYVTPSLQEADRELKHDAALTTTVYHVGFSRTEGRYVAFAYRSTNDFKSERLPYGIATKPPVTDAEVSQYPDDFIRVMTQQKQADDELPSDQRVHIGGEIQILTLQGQQMFIQTVHRFDDYDEHFATMCANLQSP
ncbi:MAG TPA: hypothetical protein VFZ65_20595 [Planctomycetota bacterium]|nr:hypothetical protein [Planctomycetota bacterium]